ncbi:CxxxxCH/CxxCH domain-containing protein [Spirochaetota bacterium]
MLLVFSNCRGINDISVISDSNCNAADCHSSTILGQFPPSSGRHIAHLAKGTDCGNCHFDYMNNPIHKNGIVDIQNGEEIISYNSDNKGSLWNNTSKSCSNLSCHGGSTLSVEWYGEDLGCASCHVPGSAIDPITTNAGGSNGKHVGHVQNAGMDCEACHSGYKSQDTHANGIYGKAETNSIINFDSANQSSAWNNITTTCSNVSCHVDGNWYDSNSSSCSFCHDVSSGNHNIHLSRGSVCENCHYDYQNNVNHRNGSTDTGSDETVVFNILNQEAAWNSSSLTCSDLSCHGGNTPSIEWYGTASGCASCHVSGNSIDPVTSNGSGSDGKHVGHVQNYGMDCETCHSGYKLQDTHFNGVYGKEVTSSIIFFNAANQSTSWNNITTTCSNVNCHGDGDWYDSNSADCTFCHSVSSGGHNVHLAKDPACENCHDDYENNANHKNGSTDTGSDETVIFSSSNPGATWNSSALTCSNLSCHGGITPPIEWYGSASGCTNCHVSGNSIDPVSTNTSGSGGKHVGHVQNDGLDCETCHSGYKSQGTHANGVYGKTEPGSIINFNAANQSTIWDNNNYTCSSGRE